MAEHFPLFLSLKDKKILLIGAGSIALQKLQVLLRFGANIAILSKSFDPAVQQLIRTHKLRTFQKRYEKGDINGYDIVIAATNDSTLHEAIYHESRDIRVLLNVVDETAYCDFIFPAIVHKGDLTLAISTGGASPLFAKRLKEHLEHTLPDETITLLQTLHDLRTTLPPSKERKARFEALIEAFFKKYDL